MRKILIIQFILSIGLCFGNDQVDYVLEQVKKGNFKTQTELRNYLHRGFDQNYLSQLTSKNKLVYSKFDIDLLHLHYVNHHNYRYIFFFDYMTQKCRFAYQLRSQARKIAMCQDQVMECTRSQKGAIDLDTFVQCSNSNPYCQNILPVEGARDIDLSYCEIVYGRKL